MLKLLTHRIVGPFFLILGLFSPVNAVGPVPPAPTPLPTTLMVAVTNDFPPVAFVNSKGQVTGMFVDIWKLWSEKTGIKVTFLPSAWKDTLEHLRTGKADLHFGVFYSKARGEWLQFSNPFYELSTSIFFLRKNRKISGINDLFGRKLGIIQNTYQANYVKRNFPKVNVVEFKSMKEIVDAAYAGDIDAFLAETLSASGLLEALGIGTDFDETKNVYSSRKIYTATTKDNKKIIDIVNKGLRYITPVEYASIEDRWISDPRKRFYKKSLPTEELSINEKKWLDQHRKFRLGLPRDLSPLAFVAEDGNMQGIIVDYADYISENSDITFEFVAADWSELTNKIKNKEIDLLCTIENNKLKQNVFFSEPFFNISYVIINRQSEPFVSSLERLTWKKVAVLDNIAIEGYIKKNHPTINVVSFNKLKDALQAVATGKVEAFVGDLVTASFAMRKTSLNNLKIAAVTAIPEDHIAFAVRRDWPVLQKLVNQVLSNMSQIEHNRITNKWLSMHHARKGSWFTAIFWSLGCLIIVAVVVIWNRRLTYEIQIREKAEHELEHSREKLQTFNEELEKRIKKRTHELEVSNDELSYEINERKHAEKILASQEMRMQAILDHSPGLISIKDLEGNYIMVNRNYRLIKGADRDIDFIGKNAYDIFPHNVADRNWKNDLKALDGEHSVESEEMFTHKDGSLHTYLTVKFPLYDNQDKPFGVCSIATDITERIRLEKEVQESEKMRVIGQLAGGIAHDFNNQLAGILGFSEILERKIREPKLLKHVKNIISASKRSSELTNQLLAFSRKGKVVTKLASLHHTIESVRHLMQRSIDKRIVIKCELDADMDVVLIDEGQIQNAILNIGINATQAMQNGGELTFKTENVSITRQTRQHFPEALAENDYVVLTVNDTGHGIDPEHINRIFEPFFTTKDFGAGMGLAAVYGIIQEHNGDVDVESSVDEGSTFRIYLPLAEEQKLKITDKDNIVIPRKLNKGKIMIVDDEEVVRDFLDDFLRMNNFDTVICQSGEIAIENYKENYDEIDLIILDMVMPDISGQECFKLLKDINSEVKVVVLTGYCVQDIIDQFVDDGVSTILSKPVQFDELLDSVSSLLETPVS